MVVTAKGIKIKEKKYYGQKTVVNTLLKEDLVKKIYIYKNCREIMLKFKTFNWISKQIQSFHCLQPMLSKIQFDKNNGMDSLKQIKSPRML